MIGFTVSIIRRLSSLEMARCFAAHLRLIESHLCRIADRFDPPPEIVGTPNVAAKLGCTTDLIATLLRDGGIPPSCLVPGTWNGSLGDSGTLGSNSGGCHSAE